MRLNEPTVHAHAVPAVATPLGHLAACKPKHPGRRKLEFRTQVDEDLKPMQLLIVLRGQFLVNDAASSVRPDDPSGADDEIVTQRVAASEVSRRVLEHVGDRREARVRVRREWPASHAEVVKDNDGGGAFSQVAKIYGLH